MKSLTILLIAILAIACCGEAKAQVPQPVTADDLNQPLDYWIDTLASGSPGDKAKAATIIYMNADTAADAIPALTAALADETPMVRQFCAQTIGQLGPVASEAGPKLADLLADSEWEVRSAAASALAKLGPTAKRFTDAIAKLASDKRDYVRISASQSVCELDPSQSDKFVGVIAAELDSQDSFVRIEACRAIAHLGPAAKSAVPNLVKMIQADVSQASTVAFALQRIGAAAKPAVPALIAAYDSGGDKKMMVAIVKALLLISPEQPEVQELLSAALENEDINTDVAIQLGRAKAVAPLKVGYESHVKIWQEHGTDTEAGRTAFASIRACLLGFAEAGPVATEYAPLFAEHAADAESLARDPYIKAIGALASNDPKVAGQLLRFPGGKETVEALAGMGSNVVPVLVEGLRNEDQQLVAARALSLIERHVAAQAAPELVQLLPTGRKTLDAEVIKALANIASEDEGAVVALGSVIQNANDYSSSDVQTAIEAIRRIGSKGAPAVAALIAAHDQSRGTRREQIVRALGSIGPGAKSAIPMLKRQRNLASLAALARIDDQYIDSFVDAVSTSSDAMTPNTIEVLCDLGPKARKAMPVLVDAKNSTPSFAAQFEIDLAILKIAPNLDQQKHILRSLVSRLQAADPYDRSAYLSRISRLGPVPASENVEDVQEAIRAWFNDKEDSVRRTAAFALWRVSPRLVDETLNVFRKELLDQDEPSSLAKFRKVPVLEQISLMGDAAKPLAGEVKLQLLDPHWETRRAARDALSSMVEKP